MTQVTRKQYEQACRYVRGANVAFPGNDAIRAYYKARGKSTDELGFGYHIDPAWINRQRRLAWRTRQLIVALFGSGFEAKS